jgi:hypothetical protein
MIPILRFRLFSKKTEADRRFSRFLGVVFFHPIFQSIQSFTGCCDSSSPGAIIAWVSRVYVGVTPSQQGVLQITSLRGSHVRGGYFELLRSQEFRRASPPPHRQKTPLLAFAHQGKDIYCV